MASIQIASFLDVVNGEIHRRKQGRSVNTNKAIMSSTQERVAKLSEPELRRLVEFLCTTQPDAVACALDLIQAPSKEPQEEEKKETPDEEEAEIVFDPTTEPPAPLASTPTAENIPSSEIGRAHV